jgi:hypothetical protein
MDSSAFELNALKGWDRLKVGVSYRDSTNAIAIYD